MHSIWMRITHETLTLIQTSFYSLYYIKMRKLTWKGLEAIPNNIGRTYYRDGVELTPDEVQKLTFEQICELTTPQTLDEREEYYYEKQAEYELEEYLLSQYDN